MTTKAKQDRIATLNDLIARASTPDGERESARRFLARLLAKKNRTSPAAAYATMYDRRSYGTKYDEHVARLTLTEIAKLIRADIKTERRYGKAEAVSGGMALINPIADAPAEITFGVRTSYYSGGGSIDIIIRNIPREWGFQVVERNGHEQDMPTPALNALAKALRDISNAYNYDGSDPMSDYFDKRFYGGVFGDRGRVLG